MSKPQLKPVRLNNKRVICKPQFCHLCRECKGLFNSISRQVLIANKELEYEYDLHMHIQVCVERAILEDIN